MARRRGGGGDGTGADYLARIYGTEEDRKNCPFYLKVGACRHGKTCKRHHITPPFATTVVIYHMWPNPYVLASGQMKEDAIQADFDAFFEDVYSEAIQVGEIDDIMVCDNQAPHLVGNVYIRYHDEGDAEKCLQLFNLRSYAGRTLHARFVATSSLHDSRCKQGRAGAGLGAGTSSEVYACDKGGDCNFIHVKEPSRDVMHNIAEQGLPIPRCWPPSVKQMGRRGPPGGGGGGGEYRDRDGSPRGGAPGGGGRYEERGPREGGGDRRRDYDDDRRRGGDDRDRRSRDDDDRRDDYRRRRSPSPRRDRDRGDDRDYRR